MSDADQNGLSVSTDGISVRKSLDTDRFDPTAVVLAIRSEREDPVRIRLLDPIPADVPADDVGFHSEYGADHWSVEGSTVVFERNIEPGEEYTTLYGLREFDDGALDRLEVEPELTVVEAGPGADVDDLADLLAAEDNQPVRDVISGERDTLPGLDTEAEAAPDVFDGGSDGAGEATDPLADGDTAEDAEDLVDIDGAVSDTATDDAGTTGDEPTAETETGPDATPADAAEAGDADDQPQAAIRPTDGDAGDDHATDDARPRPATEGSDADDAPSRPTGGVARVLAKELREGNVSEADRQLLRDELGTGDTSTEVRIDHLQSEVSDLAAYTEALEAFLDEEGTAQQILDDLSARVEDLDERLAEVEDDLARTRDETASVTDDLSALEDSVADAERRLEDVTDRLEDVEALPERVDDLEDDLATVRDDVDEMAEFRDRLESALGRLTGGIGSDDAEET